MDFIVSLLKFKGFGTIVVVVHYFSKYATFIRVTKEYPTDEATGLFLRHVVKYWGLKKNIVIDRDRWFTGKF